ncbi:MAG: phosphomannose isomerase type II C-terminal cupin domain [Syntrophales bacterium]|nr:phosphomannose isomerase type II C-terminal cupin domain [Syntrophales bacterium]
MIEHRPWGDYEVLSEEPGHKVKRIVVHPGKRLSLQRHSNRAEHWYMLSGEGVVTIDREDRPLKSGQSVDIPRRTLHRMKNSGKEPVMFIEVQTGDYLGEDDIERVEDDFGRV